jgi:hypothetical protein
MFHLYEIPYNFNGGSVAPLPCDTGGEGAGVGSASVLISELNPGEEKSRHPTPPTFNQGKAATAVVLQWCSAIFAALQGLIL